MRTSAPDCRHRMGRRGQRRRPVRRWRRVPSGRHRPAARPSRARGLDIGAEHCSSRKARNASSAALRSVMPAAMAWPPPFSSSPAATAWRTARPRSTPAIERPEPVPMSPGSERDREGGAAEALLQPRGDEPDDARMPARRRRHHDGALLLDPERRHAPRPLPPRRRPARSPGARG